MKNKRSIQLNAAFLITVFSLNTVIGFACAIGMTFKASHHDEETVHVHSDGKKHIHQNQATKTHEEADKDHHKSKDGKENCCNEKVIQIAQLDKFVPQSLSIVTPIFFTIFVSAFYNIDVSFLSKGTPNIKYFVRSHHPPIPEIRIAIQSFQI